MKKKSAHKVVERNVPVEVNVFKTIKHTLKTRRRMQREADLFTSEELVKELINQDALTKVVSWFELCGHEITDIYIDGATDAIDVAGKRFQIKNLRPDVDSLDELKNEFVTVDLAGSWDNTDPKPFGTILVNSNMTCAAVVLASTASSWTKIHKWKKRWHVFYTCPVEEILFYNLEEKSDLNWLKNDDSEDTRIIDAGTSTLVLTH